MAIFGSGEEVVHATALSAGASRVEYADVEGAIMEKKNPAPQKTRRISEDILPRTSTLKNAQKYGFEFRFRKSR